MYTYTCIHVYSVSLSVDCHFYFLLFGSTEVEVTSNALTLCMLHLHTVDLLEICDSSSDILWMFKAIIRQVALKNTQKTVMVDLAVFSQNSVLSVRSLPNYHHM